MENKSNKVIHYIWFGGNPISELTKKCIQSWKKYLPDFEIKEWNETNFDVNQCPFVKEAYEQKKWAFVADYTRFKVLEEFGGLYLDTDMEVTKDVAEFLEKDLFMGVEDSKMINAAVVWAKEAHNPHIKDILKIYEDKKHFNETGDLYDASVPKVLTKYFTQFGFDGEKDEIQVFDNETAWIYPMEYFYPKSYDYQHNKFTDNSAMIHHFDATWISPMEKFKTNMKRKNMVWVVYVIDFFISMKNKIKFFSNPRDITLFLVMFCMLLCSMFAFKPVSGYTDITSTSIWQILGITAIWTYITAKIRIVDVNAYGDKLANIKEGEFRKTEFNLEQTKKFYGRQNTIFAFQLILTILVGLCPILGVVSMIPTKGFIGILLMAINMYFVYLGVKTNFKFRILELIPFGIILGLIAMLYPTVGILTALATFGFVLTNLCINKVNNKRKISFTASFVATLVVLGILVAFIPSINNFGSFEIATALNEKLPLAEKVDTAMFTEFNAAKGFFVNNFNKMVESNCIFLNYLTHLIICIVIPVITAIIAKNKKFIFFAALSIFNMVALFTGATYLFSLAVIVELILIVFLLEVTLDRILNRE